jgi:hypothetical protein
MADPAAAPPPLAAPRRTLDESPWAGALLALLLALAILRFVAPRPQPLDTLPADAWIYAAIADNPDVFTARPWGYRMLGPWLVHALDSARGFARVSIGALALAAPALFLFLRRRGNSTLPALAAVALFTLSAPVAEGTRDPYLCEPLTAALGIAFLLAVESEASLGVLALTLTAAVLAKEIQVALIPLVYVARRGEKGDLRAAADAAVVAALPILACLLMRARWTGYLHTPYHAPALAVLPVALARLQRSFLQTSFLLGGLTPLAAAAALLPQSRPFLRRYGWLLALFLVLPFTAWIYDPRPNRVPFFGETVRRLMIYPLPLVLALVLEGLRRVWPRAAAPAPKAVRLPRGVAVACAALAVAAATWPAWGTDSYRRGEMLGGLDGVVVRAVCRESVAAMRALEDGTRVAFVPEELDRSPGRLARVRWMLREGWGERPYYGPGPATTEGEAASLLLPSPGRVDLDVAVHATMSTSARLIASINGRPLPLARLSTPPTLIHIPAAALFRGDNVLTLRLDPPAPLTLTRVDLIPR